MTGSWSQDSRRESQGSQGVNRGRGSRYSALDGEEEVELLDMQELSRGQKPFKEITRRANAPQDEREFDFGLKITDLSDVIEGKKRGPTSKNQGVISHVVPKQLGPQTDFSLLTHAKDKLDQEATYASDRGQLSPVAMDESHTNDTIARRSGEELVSDEEGRNNDASSAWYNQENMEEDKEPPDPGASSRGLLVHSNSLLEESRATEALGSEDHML